jgi:hypothetical protein
MAPRFLALIVLAGSCATSAKTPNSEPEASCAQCDAGGGAATADARTREAAAMVPDSGPRDAAAAPLARDATAVAELPADLATVDEAVAGEPMLSVYPTVQAYGGAVGVMNATTFFTVGNLGGAPIATPSVALEGANAADFEVKTNGCAGPVAPNRSCPVVIAFAPRSAGMKTATLVLTSPPRLRATAQLTGMAIAGGRVSIIPGNLLYPPSHVGNASDHVNEYVENTSNMPVGPLELQFSDSHFEIFESGNCAGFVLMPGDMCKFEALFRAGEKGRVSAYLTVLAGGRPVGLTAVFGIGNF